MGFSESSRSGVQQEPSRVGEEALVPWECWGPAAAGSGCKPAAVGSGFYLGPFWSLPLGNNVWRHFWLSVLGWE